MANIQLKDLIPGKEYNIQVRSVNNLGESSEWSTTYSFTAPPQTIDPITSQPAPLETIFATQVGAGDGTNTSGLFKSSTFDGSVSSSDFSIPTLLSGAIDPAYVGTTGWAMDYKGNAVFSNAYVRGFINAQSGVFSGDITSTATISGGTIQTSSIQKISLDGTSDAISFTDTLGEKVAHITSAIADPLDGFQFQKGILMHIGQDANKNVGSSYPFIYLSGEPETSDGSIILATATGNFISAATYQNGEISLVNISGTNVEISGDTGIAGDLNVTGDINATTFYGDLVGNASSATDATNASWADSAGDLNGYITSDWWVEGSDPDGRFTWHGAVIQPATGDTMLLEADSRISSFRIYKNTTTTGANVNISTGGLMSIQRVSSSFHIKDEIKTLSNYSELSSIIPQEKRSGTGDINLLEFLNVTPVSFKSISENDDNDIVRIGFIAQDIAEKTPEIATYDENGNVVYFDSHGVMSALLAICQNQEQRIKNLESRLAAL